MRTWDDYKKTMRSEDVIFSLARAGDAEALKQLQLTPERIEAKNPSGYSPLMLAAYNGQTEAVQVLLEAGAVVDSTDPAGSTVLMGAAFKGDLAVVKILIEAGADVSARNMKGQTALDFANLFGRSEVARYLKDKQNQSPIYGLKDILQGWKSFIFPRRSLQDGK